VTDGHDSSLDPILQEARLEREAQARHFDALDAKAGVILGFAGAIVALVPGGNQLVDIGRLAAAASGLAALYSFWPRGFGEVDVRRLRDLYLGSDPEFTKLLLLDTQVGLVEAMVAVLGQRAKRLQAAMLALGSATLLTAVGLAMR
jgi:hypothetical protein